MDSYKPEKQQRLQFRLVAWIVEDCQPLVVVEGQKFREFCYEMDLHFKVPGPALVKTTIQKSLSTNIFDDEWPLLGDEDSELDSFELVQQNFSIKTTTNFYPNINTRQTEKQSNIVEPIRDTPIQKYELYQQRKKKMVQDKLSEIIEMAANTINTRTQTEIDRFYDGESQVEHFMNNELE
ncbi:27972_t:CDS:2, partial [Dentiscutata erythropus]